MSCDVNWKKLQQTLKGRSKPKSTDVKTNASNNVKESVSKKTYKQKKSLEASKANDEIVIAKSVLSDFSRKREFTKEDWEDEEINFDVQVAPKVLKRDVNFEKFLLDEHEIQPSYRVSAKNEKKKSVNTNVLQPSVATVDVYIPKGLKDRPKPKLRSTDLVLKNASKEPTKVMGIDCEMVGAMHSGKFSILARVSIVNSHGSVLYDEFVKPVAEVTDFRTEVSGVTPELLESRGVPFSQVQSHVAKLLKGRIIVGHALSHDLKVLYLNHPKENIRDTSHFPLFRKYARVSGVAPSLRVLAQEILGVQIQTGEHDSVQDAQAAVKLYLLYKTQWDQWLHFRSKKNDKINKFPKKRTKFLLNNDTS